jgi:hypothetical protein
MTNNPKLFTKTLTSTDTPLTINSECGFTIFSIKGLVGVIATIEGTGKLCGMSSDPIPITEAETLTIGNQSGFGEFTITITSGSVKLVAQQ